MRHGKKVHKLGRKSGHRKHLLSNLACSLIQHKRINTTLPKGKALRRYVEPLITRSKQDNTHSRRVVFRYLQDKDVVTELFRGVATKVADRPGGYVRIIKTGFRKGDNAEMCMVELVDYNEAYVKEEDKKKDESGKGGRRRRRRGGRKKKGDQQQGQAQAGAEAGTSTEEQTSGEEAPGDVQDSETSGTETGTAPEGSGETEEKGSGEGNEGTESRSAQQDETSEASSGSGQETAGNEKGDEASGEEKDEGPEDEKGGDDSGKKSDDEQS